MYPWIPSVSVYVYITESHFHLMYWLSTAALLGPLPLKINNAPIHFHQRLSFLFSLITPLISAVNCPLISLVTLITVYDSRHLKKFYATYESNIILIRN